MYLGIDQQSGLVYEGIDSPPLPVVPRAIVIQAKMIKVENDWNELPAGVAHSLTSWVFREDAFDPVTAPGAEGSTKPSLASRQRIASCLIRMRIPSAEPRGRVVALSRIYTPTKRVDRFYRNHTKVWG
jgi:hypothetical protein